MIVDPWGVVLAQAPDGEAFDRRPTSTSSARTRSGARCRRWPTAGPEVYA